MGFNRVVMTHLEVEDEVLKKIKKTSFNIIRMELVTKPFENICLNQATTMFSKVRRSDFI